MTHYWKVVHISFKFNFSFCRTLQLGDRLSCLLFYRYLDKISTWRPAILMILIGFLSPVRQIPGQYIKHGNGHLFHISVTYHHLVIRLYMDISFKKWNKLMWDDEGVERIKGMLRNKIHICLFYTIYYENIIQKLLSCVANTVSVVSNDNEFGILTWEEGMSIACQRGTARDVSHGGVEITGYLNSFVAV
jgi:hypothetical protein